MFAELFVRSRLVESQDAAATAFKAGYFPKFLGLLLVAAGLGISSISFAHFLNPAFAATLLPAIFVPAFVGELSLALWLIAKGVDRT